MTFEEEFKKDRDVEKKTGAINNYFKLFLLAEKTKGNNDSFKLLGGVEKLQQLITDINEDNIEVTVWNQNPTVLFEALGENLKHLESITSSKSTVSLAIIDDAKRIQKVFKDYAYINVGTPLYELLICIPAEYRKTALDSIDKEFTKIKKIEER